LLLHDTVEDTDLTQEELENIFDTEVMSLVDNVTKREDETREEYMKRVENTTDLRSKIAKCIDRYHNLIRSFSMNTQNYNNKKRTFKEYLTKYVKESEEVYAPAFEKIKELEPLAMKFFRTLDEVKLRLSRMD
jgi:(p)ppGpp synthase/HD superfamily hydrolase